MVTSQKMTRPSLCMSSISRVRGWRLAASRSKVASLGPGIEQVAQLPNVTGGVAVFQTEVGQHSLGTALSSMGKQFVEVLLA